MPQSHSDTQFAEMVGRWCALALRRHAHFADLCETGRWRHYYTESQFTAELHKLVQMVERWRMLATEAVGGNRPAEAGEEQEKRWHRAA
jgi:uncharacterized repeat protein (TIGR03809 family)